LREPKDDHYILLDMAEALCEAKCVDQGICAKCMSCFGPNGDVAEDGANVGKYRSAGLLLTNPKPNGARMATATEPLTVVSPELRRHQNLVKTGLAMLMRTGIDREGGSRPTMPARSADGTL
jgi:hypothetical protein